MRRIGCSHLDCLFGIGKANGTSEVCGAGLMDIFIRMDKFVECIVQYTTINRCQCNGPVSLPSALLIRQ